MLIAHYAPRLAGSGGRSTRAAVLADAIGSQPLDSVAALEAQPWDIVLVDTNPVGPDGELEMVLPRLHTAGARLVLLARTLSHETPAPAVYDDVLAIGPYETAGGDAIGPLIAIPKAADQDVDVLMVVGSADRRWWSRQAAMIQGAGHDLTVLARAPLVRFPGPDCYRGPVVSGAGADWIGRAKVVVGGGGVGTLYETLWSGGRLVARGFTPEQQDRIRVAIGADEAIARVWSIDETLPALERVKTLEPLGRRRSGVATLRKRLNLPK